MDTNSNGVANHEEGNGASAQGDASEPAERTKIITRRGRSLVLLDEAASDGLTLDALYQRLVVEHPLATLQIVRQDVLLFIAAGVGEERPPAEPRGEHRYALTLKGEKALEQKGWTKLAERLTNEEQAPKAEPPTTPAAPPTLPQDGPTRFAGAIAASAAKEAEEKREKAGKGRKKKGSKDPSPQLGLGSGPGRFTMMLPCPLSAEEFKGLQEAHLDACDEVDALDEERKEANKRFTERREKLEEAEAKARAELRVAVISAKQLRDVECEQRLDGSTMRIFRLDTGEMVEERAATAAELEAANPPPPAVSVPEGGEVREANTGASADTAGDKSAAMPAESLADDTDTSKATGGRRKKPKDTQAAVH